MKKPTILNIDESPANGDWLHTYWNTDTLPPYKSEDFYIWLNESGMTLAEFKTTGRYRKAVRERRIVNDRWVPRK